MSDTQFKIGDRVKVVRPGSGTGPLGNVTTVTGVGEDFISVTGDRPGPSSLFGRLANRYALVEPEPAKVVDPYKYDGLTLTCDFDSADSVDLSLEDKTVSLRTVVSGVEGIVCLSPKKARKLAKALKALAATAESDIG